MPTFEAPGSWDRIPILSKPGVTGSESYPTFSEQSTPRVSLRVLCDLRVSNALSKSPGTAVFSAISRRSFHGILTSLAKRTFLGARHGDRSASATRLLQDRSRFTAQI